ncbi:glycosyltransferase [Litorivicinus lipolyticus]|uniref:Glycosyltransferase n=1 Tax=Litorivicinus lipolyticus TaxID=418701 RepID=A0A5Q2QA07_9GAMM|nr:glycosyltransferase family 4 protein [Litorivicinus lipolyticus]QGG79091.1 glycosyltransferase [Litorivicinus lipolyticus]
MPNLKVVQVVKRFGPVGGMERYVWELSHELAARGVEIVILCEKAYESPAPNFPIRVICLGETRPKPRWISMLRFSRRVTQAVNAHGLTSDNGWVIHSHERTGVHQVTTFHGPPMASVKERQTFWFLSPRLVVWLFLERRELLRPDSHVLPNSLLIKNKLLGYYSHIKFGDVAWPGVHVPKGPRIEAGVPGSDVVFVGREYRRKGLETLILALEHLRQTRKVTLAIVGAEQDARLEWLIRGRGWINNISWVSDLRISDYGKVLVHPAEDEPYGMAIAEAAAQGLACVVSDQCGAKDHIKSVRVVPLDASVETWATAIDMGLDAEQLEPAPFTWPDLADVCIKEYQGVIRRLPTS